jgi:hypothetical protein
VAAATQLGEDFTLRRHFWEGLILCWLTGFVQAREPELSFDLDDIEVSYIYAAVMGTGSYRINDRSISMFRLPLSWNQREAGAETTGWKWLFPVVLGYDDLGHVDSDWFERLLPDQLVTLTALPGLELSFPVTPGWTLKPFAQLGGGRNFSVEETFFMTHIGVRSLSLFDLSERWSLRWGNALGWAAEYQMHSNDRTSFGLFETGLDFRRVLPMKIFGQSADVGAFYIYQRYLPEWNIGEAPDRRFETRDLHEFGLSLGVREGRKIFGIPLRRLRVGYKKGGSFQGWTIGTEFPF